MSGISLGGALGYSSLLANKLSSVASGISGIGNAAAIANASKVSDAGSGSDASGVSESGSVKPKGAADKFLEYMEMSDAEKLKYALLAEMGISKEQYDAMSPEQRAEIDKKIADRMAQIAQSQSQSGAPVHGVAAKLQTFVESAQANEKKMPLLDFEV